jgi:hypothetical protein
MRVLFAIPLTLAIAGLVWAGQSATTVRDTADVSTASPATAPAITSTPAAHVTVNGESIPVGKDGTAHVNRLGAQVEVSGGKTTVTSTTGSGAATNTQSGDVTVSIDSNSHNGTSWISSQTSGDNANGSSTSFSSTTVFSSGSAYSHVSEP